MKHQLLSNLTHEHGTSFYLFYPERFTHNINSFRSEIRRYYQNSNVAYAYKANYMPLLGHYLNQLNALGEVVSGLEYEIARIHLPARQIIFNGPGKSTNDMSLAIDEGALINLDSFQEINQLEGLLHDAKQCVSVGLRVNFDIGKGHSRFGFSHEDGSLRRAAERLYSIKNVKIVCLHSHFTTRERSLDLFTQRIAGMLSIYDTFPNNREIRTLNIGGGFFGPMSEGAKSNFKVPAPAFSEYADVIGKQMARHFGTGRPELIVEPGVSMIANTMDFVTQVLDRKIIRGRKFLTVDGSVNNLFPTGSRYTPEFKVISKKKNLPKECCDVVGYTCMEDDILLPDTEIAAEPGDFLVFTNRGAYSSVYKPPFIKAAPAIIGLHGEVFARRQTPADIISQYNCRIPRA